MKKNLIIFVALIFLVLMTLSISSATDEVVSIENKAKSSPLYKFRAQKTINEKLEDFVIKHLKNRLFLNVEIPTANMPVRYHIQQKTSNPIDCPYTMWPTHYRCCSIFAD